MERQEGPFPLRSVGSDTHAKTASLELGPCQNRHSEAHDAEAHACFFAASQPWNHLAMSISSFITASSLIASSSGSSISASLSAVSIAGSLAAIVCASTALASASLSSTAAPQPSISVHSLPPPPSRPPPSPPPSPPPPSAPPVSPPPSSPPPPLWHHLPHQSLAAAPSAATFAAAIAAATIVAPRPAGSDSPSLAAPSSVAAAVAAVVSVRGRRPCSPAPLHRRTTGCSPVEPNQPCVAVMSCAMGKAVPPAVRSLTYVVCRVRCVVAGAVWGEAQRAPPPERGVGGSPDQATPP